VGVTLRLRAPVVGDVDLAADDRLDSLLVGAAINLHCTSEGTVVCERNFGHLELGSALGERGSPASTIRIDYLGVDVKVDEPSFRHGRLFWTRLRTALCLGWLAKPEARRLRFVSLIPAALISRWVVH
jgi:hypothetical protein